MQESKWEYLKPWALKIREESPGLAIKGIAELAIATFDLDLEVEQARKIISRLLNREEQVEEKPILVSPVNQYITDSVRRKLKGKPELHIKHNQPGTYVVLGCMHAPFCNEQMLSGIIQMINDTQPDGLILAGDFLDCNSLSGHDRGKFTVIPGLSLKQEYELGSEIIDLLTDGLPDNALKVYMYGNHEDRYQRFIADMQNAKTPPQSPTEGLNLYERGFKVIESYSSGYMTLGAHLDILHGIYYNTHCAKQHIDRFRGSVLFAHTHRIQSYIEGHTGGFNIGWGGDANSRAFGYADRGTKASWQNGFAVVTIDKDGDYYVNQIICNNGHFYYNGNRY